MSDRLPSPQELYEGHYGPAIFGPLADLFVPWLAPPPGGRVLELACGTGAATRRIAAAVGPTGRIVALDVSPAMVAVARRATRELAAPVEWRVGDAGELDVAGPFDLAVCQQGLQFFGDRAGALERARARLVPGGRIGIAVWQGVERQTLFAEFAEVEARHLEPLGVSYDDLIAPFALGGDGVVEGLLEAAGFDAAEVRHVPFEADFPDPRTFTRSMETAYAAVIPAFVEDPMAFEDYVASVERDAAGIVDRYTVGGRVRFAMPALLARAVAS